MKKALSIAVPMVLLAAIPMLLSADGPLTNRDVVAMHEAGLGDQLIVTTVESNRGEFDVSAEALIGLKKKGLSDAVIAAMMESANDGSSVAGALGSAASNPGAMTDEPGLYWRANGDEPFERLEPTVFSQGRAGGKWKSALTMGVMKAKWKAILPTASANAQIRSRRPEFLFVFERKTSGLSQTGGFQTGGFYPAVSGASSPNEFILARFTLKNGRRELPIGEASAFVQSTGTRPEDTVPFDFERLEPGKYLVHPTITLGPGEYGFFYAAMNSVGTQSSGGRIFDFGVR